MKTPTPVRLALLAVVASLIVPLSAFAQNTVVTYQGRVQSGGADFSGTGQFKFALVTATNIARTATATANLTGGFVTSYTVTFSGSGYVTAPAVTITGGGGSGATATATISRGEVTAINPVSAGIGYTSPPSVIIASPPDQVVYATCWSNDGSSTDGSEPVGCVSVRVNEGLFTVRLGDTGLANMTALGMGVFSQPELKLRIWFSDAVNGFAALSPLQSLTATPYAVTAGNLAEILPGSRLSGTYGNAVIFTNAGNSFTGNGAELTGLNAGSLATGTVPDARLSGNVARTSQVWLLGGNTRTMPGKDFLGTADNEALELKVNGQRVLRFEDNGDGSSDIDNLPDGAPNVIGGSATNFVAEGVVGATIGGGGATNLDGTACPNSIGGDFGTIGGGDGNTIGPGGWNSVIGGGFYNSVTDGAATVSGGGGNAVGGGSTFGTISGGYDNHIGGGGVAAVIGGGQGNVIAGGHATIAGGLNNSIDTNSSYVAIGGGTENEAGPATYDVTIAGGGYNSVGARCMYATIGGGCENEIPAYANWATIPGGNWNFATTNAFAAGSHARAVHLGAFVWGDATEANVFSMGANSLTMRASGGYRLFSDSGSTVGAYLAAGGGSWTTLSDRNAKENVSPVNATAVLEKLTDLPVSSWNYKTQDRAVRHIGPMAQDFKAAFGVGESETGITTVDADGVALAAIQGLNQKVEEQRRRLEQKQADISELKQRIQALEQALAAGLNRAER